VTNHRNVKSAKTVLTNTGAIAIDVPRDPLQTCIVHLIRNSLDYASWKDRKALAAAIKPIYTATSADAAIKLMWLALRNITADWSRAANNWKTTMNQPRNRS
jgi:transposase-like protein